MPTNTSSPTVIPMIAYEDASAALEWLAKAFGFRECTRIMMPDGSIGHAEMEVGDGVIMLAEPDPHYEGPARHARTGTVALSRKAPKKPGEVEALLIGKAPRAARTAQSGP